MIPGNERQIERQRVRGDQQIVRADERAAARENEDMTGVNIATPSIVVLRMRTTVTLEPDVAAKLKELAHKRRASFKATLNDVLRKGLAPQ